MVRPHELPHALFGHRPLVQVVPAAVRDVEQHHLSLPDNLPKPAQLPDLPPQRALRAGCRAAEDHVLVLVRLNAPPAQGIQRAVRIPEDNKRRRLVEQIPTRFGDVADGLALKWEAVDGLRDQGDNVLVDHVPARAQHDQMRDLLYPKLVGEIGSASARRLERNGEPRHRSRVLVEPLLILVQGDLDDLKVVAALPDLLVRLPQLRREHLAGLAPGSREVKGCILPLEPSGLHLHPVAPHKNIPDGRDCGWRRDVEEALGVVGDRGAPLAGDQLPSPPVQEHHHRHPRDPVLLAQPLLEVALVVGQREPRRGAAVLVEHRAGAVAADLHYLKRLGAPLCPLVGCLCYGGELSARGAPPRGEVEPDDVCPHRRGADRLLGLVGEKLRLAAQEPVHHPSLQLLPSGGVGLAEPLGAGFL
eukprot:CAMPEP_0206240720 /NCGR_PEP_ID=MMETSP0047_2-20121206/16092_1 /ASSEMBLY_ACC=CAM_ASM_000192 /TAXON_ID=195065 /ORGANISM="Chroomonas mesostigmatica_cf, Strain CCMP1168" /LENGTH=416 /DNA_ID=CAMNT_0053665527 /DNA_START=75 /DNA_END=1323 /DNA_ORIENTATION=+